LGIEACLITDSYCFSALEAAAASSGFPRERLVCYSHRTAAASSRAGLWLDPPMPTLSHLIAVGGVGPSRPAPSLGSQRRQGPAPLEKVNAQVREEHRNCCHNMRGENIDRFAGDVHSLFEECAGILPQIRTIGIGDGANEIGMGFALWEDLERRLSG